MNVASKSVAFPLFVVANCTHSLCLVWRNASFAEFLAEQFHWMALSPSSWGKGRKFGVFTCNFKMPHAIHAALCHVMSFSPKAKVSNTLVCHKKDSPILSPFWWPSSTHFSVQLYHFWNEVIKTYTGSPKQLLIDLNKDIAILAIYFSVHFLAIH